MRPAFVGIVYVAIVADIVKMLRDAAAGLLNEVSEQRGVGFAFEHPFVGRAINAIASFDDFEEFFAILMSCRLAAALLP
jgi:hypothetical protein